jgi:hypothetical protein
MVKGVIIKKHIIKRPLLFDFLFLKTAQIIILKMNLSICPYRIEILYLLISLKAPNSTIC